MAKRKGAGLLMVMADVPSDKEEEFNRWYNEEHLEDVTSVPGVLNGARYQAVKGGPKYLAIYELETYEVTQTPEFTKIREQPTEWSKTMSPSIIGTNFARYTYRQIFPNGVSPTVADTDLAPVLQIGRMSVPPEIDAEFSDWYNSIYIPGYEKVPGCTSGRRYVAVDGQPKYGTVYELDHEKVSETPEWLKARESNPKSAEIRAKMTHAQGSPAVYKKIFQL